MINKILFFILLIALLIGLLGKWFFVVVGGAIVIWIAYEVWYYYAVDRYR